ncbi:uncharacterized protein VTP21DRAFT_7599 [Calcarisporiella thermophila]|uniref:uncharacterized protein n=1 Tax=Calcarisporiella thermophila TaxID=911321 RepID=UPI003743CD59
MKEVMESGNVEKAEEEEGDLVLSCSQFNGKADSDHNFYEESSMDLVSYPAKVLPLRSSSATCYNTLAKSAYLHPPNHSCPSLVSSRVSSRCGTSDAESEDHLDDPEEEDAKSSEMQMGGDAAVLGALWTNVDEKERKYGDPKACLHVGNLPINMKEEELRDQLGYLFEKYGPLLHEIKISYDINRLPTAFVQFQHFRDAQAVIEASNLSIGGRRPRIREAHCNRCWIIAGVPKEFDEEDFREMFTCYDHIEDIRVLCNSQTGERKGAIAVIFEHYEDANAHLPGLRRDFPNWRIKKVSLEDALEFGKPIYRDTGVFVRFITNPTVGIEEALRKQCELFGNIVNIEIVRGSGYDRGAYAIVVYGEAEAAKNAQVIMDNTTLLDTHIRVDPLETNEFSYPFKHKRLPDPNPPSTSDFPPTSTPSSQESSCHQRVQQGLVLTEQFSNLVIPFFHFLPAQFSNMNLQQHPHLHLQPPSYNRYAFPRSEFQLSNTAPWTWESFSWLVPQHPSSHLSAYDAVRMNPASLVGLTEHPYPPAQPPMMMPAYCSALNWIKSHRRRFHRRKSYSNNIHLQP